MNDTTPDNGGDSAALLTAVGLVPEGNTGGGNTSAFRRMPIPPELVQIIISARGRPPL